MLIASFKEKLYTEDVLFDSCKDTSARSIYYFEKFYDYFFPYARRYKKVLSFESDNDIKNAYELSDYEDLSLYIRHEDERVNKDGHGNKFKKKYRKNENGNEELFDDYTNLDWNDEWCKETAKTIKEVRILQLTKFVMEQIKKEKIGTVKRVLLSVLDNDKDHKGQKSKNIIRQYIDSLIEFSNRDPNFVKEDDLGVKFWVKALYLFINYAVLNNLPEELYIYPRDAYRDAYKYANLDFSSDLEEYNEKITLMYGACSDTGIGKLYELANREKPNLIALYECGDLEYYGKGPSRKVNYSKAYKYYNDTRTKLPNHPLATWSILWMKWDYFQQYIIEKKELKPQYEVNEIIREYGESLNEYKWVESLFYEAKKLLDKSELRDCLAANLLGHIMESVESIQKKDQHYTVDEWHAQYGELTAADYYRISCDLGYSYGIDNYVRFIWEKSLAEESMSYAIAAVKYCTKSAEEGSIYGNDRMGVFYYQDVSDIKSGLIPYKVSELVDPYTEKLLIGKKSRKNEEALSYFIKAYQLIHAKKFYWPLIHIWNYFILKDEFNIDDYDDKTKNQLRVIINNYYDDLSIVETLEVKEKEKVQEIMKNPLFGIRVDGVDEKRRNK